MMPHYTESEYWSIHVNIVYSDCQWLFRLLSIRVFAITDYLILSTSNARNCLQAKVMLCNGPTALPH